MTPTLDSEGRPVPERYDDMFTIRPEGAAKPMLVHLLARSFAHVTDFNINDGDHLGRAVYPEHCSVCQRNGMGDGSGRCPHKDALYQAEAAQIDQAEAERVSEMVAGKNTELPF